MLWNMCCQSNMNKPLLENAEEEELMEYRYAFTGYDRYSRRYVWTSSHRYAPMDHARSRQCAPICMLCWMNPTSVMWYA